MSTPRYIVWAGFREWKVCETLVQALDWKSKLGGTVYEPLGMTTAETVYAEHDPSMKSSRCENCGRHFDHDAKLNSIHCSLCDDWLHWKDEEKRDA